MSGAPPDGEGEWWSSLRPPQSFNKEKKSKVSQMPSLSYHDMSYHITTHPFIINVPVPFDAWCVRQRLRQRRQRQRHGHAHHKEQEEQWHKEQQEHGTYQLRLHGSDGPTKQATDLRRRGADCSFSYSFLIHFFLSFFFSFFLSFFLSFQFRR